ncbi:MAG: cupredoxin family copper-binding protein [Actinomycetota bacterium]|nr:cupredoxin family copper-binding protein [Actinomycetota bacterium]
MTPLSLETRHDLPRGGGRARLRLSAMAIVLVLCGFVTACGSATKTTTPAPGSAASGGNSVTIKNFTFQPQALTVKVGTTVTWTNQDSTPHTVQFSNKSVPTSADLSAGGGQSTYSHTFTAPGTYPYICGIHNDMTGTIKVTP